MKLTVLLLTILLALNVTSKALAHGLNMSTAQVTLRQNNHISIRVHTSLKEVLAQINWHGKPASFTEIATTTEDGLKPMSLALHTLFTKNMPVSIGKKNMASKKARLPSIKQLQAKLQKALAKSLINQHQGHHQDEFHRSNDLIIEIDGFIPTGVSNSQININFPKELGPIMVSYNKPQVQTLKAGKNATIYRQTL